VDCACPLQNANLFPDGSANLEPMVGTNRRPLGVTAAILGGVIGLVLNNCSPFPALMARLTEGTTTSVQKCIERNMGASGDDRLVRADCIDRYETLLSEEIVDGRAGYRSDADGMRIVGTLINKSDRYVITDVLLHFNHKTIPAAFQPVHLTDLWIAPGASAAFQEDRLEFIPPEGSEGDVVWRVGVVRGIAQGTR
jgi:hypothetical protein